MSDKAEAPRVISPSKLGHVVLRTDDLKKLSLFYKTFLGARAQAESDTYSFLTYDNEHHRLAIFQRPDLKPVSPKICGLEHIAFGFADIESLLEAYAQRKEHDIKPIACVHHGVTISMYYVDPDGNRLETFVDGFDDPETSTAYMASKEFVDDPIGPEFDPDDWLKRLQDGEAADNLYRKPPRHQKTRRWGVRA